MMLIATLIHREKSLQTSVDHQLKDPQLLISLGIF